MSRKMTAHIRGDREDDEIARLILKYKHIAKSVGWRVSRKFHMDEDFCYSHAMQSLWLFARVLDESLVPEPGRVVYKRVYDRTRSYAKQEVFRVRTIKSVPFSVIESDDDNCFQVEHKVASPLSHRLGEYAYEKACKMLTATELQLLDQIKDGMTFKAIGETHGVTHEAIRSRYGRILTMLRDALKSDRYFADVGKGYIEEVSK